MLKLSTIGIISYHYPHLKTEQVLQRILNKIINGRYMRCHFLKEKKEKFYSPIDQSRLML
jgi:hypothetical protein